MARIELTLSQSHLDYIAEIKPQVHFKQCSMLESTATFLGKLGNVVWLNVSNACNVVSIAKQFQLEMSNMDKDAEELSFELSFLNEAIITELEIPVSQRNLDVVNMAILQTLCSHKQIALINHAKALQLQLPGNPDIGTMATPVASHEIELNATSTGSYSVDCDIDFTVPDLS